MHLILDTTDLKKERVVTAIITGKTVKPTAKSDVKKRIEKEKVDAVKAAKKDKKPDIKKGITYQDLFQLYLRTEIEEYCRDKGLKLTGKKSDLIKRILTFLGGDKDTTKSPKKEKS